MTAIYIFIYSIQVPFSKSDKAQAYQSYIIFYNKINPMLKENKPDYF